MDSSCRSQLTAKIIASALALISVLVITDGVTDPVNVTKFFAIGGFAFAALGTILNNASLKLLKKAKFPLFTVFGFLVISFIVLFQSKAPLTQSLYGVYGRNNGFILYLFLSFLFIASLTIHSKNDFSYAIYGLIVAGTVNVFYGLWVMAFGDFLSWNNQYGNLLGTFGNPNFIGSFFGMFSSVLFTAVLSKSTDTRIRLVALFFLPLVFITILDTKAVQGIVLFVAAGGIVSFFYIRERFQSKYWSITYLFLAILCSTVALFGTLQKGPLAGVLYKPSVSLRGEYWYSGWRTGIDNPWFGVGFDSLGDWYRRSRRESALTLPGIDTVINTAHNVYLDMFAFGGWPLFLSYSLLTGCVLVSILRFSRSHKKFDFTFVTLVSVWTCYQLQSIISINQVGLAIWGWVTGGLLIAYTRANKKEVDANQLATKKKYKSRNISNSGEIFSPRLFAGLLAVVGFLISVPPLSADMKWREAQVALDISKFESTLKPSYMNPLSTFKLTNIVAIFETSGLFDLAHKYAIEAVEFNPNSYESWKTLSLIKNATEQERAMAYAEMKRLDPLNPTLKGGK